MPTIGDDVQQSASTTKSPPAQTIARFPSARAESLASRIEEGAVRLAAFAEALSDAEWRTPVSLTDRRPVGVVVHHVASMYPIEIDLARAVARGRSVTDVTWEVVAQVNAKHAQDFALVSKSVALELLQENSRKAAAAVRDFTDQELDNTALFSLSFGAPMTTQFVIEDHAMRHSWHHLAAIRKALGS
jgi:DinB family protein